MTTVVLREKAEERRDGLMELVWVRAAATLSMRVSIIPVIYQVINIKYFCKGKVYIEDFRNWSFKVSWEIVLALVLLFFPYHANMLN